MDELKQIYNSIRERSRSIIADDFNWVYKLRGAKNYVCTPDLKHWTFGKTIWRTGAASVNGGAAKRKLYRLGFVNILERPSIDPLRITIEEAFMKWASNIKWIDIGEKYRSAPSGAWDFELLIHQNVKDKLTPKIEREVEQQKEFDEGFREETVRTIVERNPDLVTRAKVYHGVACGVCEMTFEEVYGEHGKGFVEMHHLYPVKDGMRKNTVDDLRPVCANCHRMLHRGSALMSIEDLKEIVKERKGKKI